MKTPFWIRYTVCSHRMTITQGPYIWKRPCILYSKIPRPYILARYLDEESPRHPNESSKIILTCFYSQILILLHIFHIISIEFFVSFLTLPIRRVSDFQFLYAQSVPYWITISLFLQFFKKFFSFQWNCQYSINRTRLELEFSPPDSLCALYKYYLK